ncbi:MAG TPA: FAD-dependent oxidoreductase [Sulfuricurvum sp.]|nr:FAD-dependent oxidoreductase [Sulfuricurvum sp.]
MKKLAIIGGGLSGLYAAYTLKNDYKITIFEARDRLGGRVCTVEGFDMGPSWIWSHQDRILSLIHSLKIELFPQYTRGYALYDTPQGVQRFTPPPSSPSARMKGGLITLIDALASALHPESIRLREPVHSISTQNESMVLETAQGHYEADRILCTLPPRVALETITYSPPLPSTLTQKLSDIPTWMGHTAKCVIEFKTPFWREAGLSGFCFSHIGPLGEVHDACTDDRPALFGFVHSGASMDTIETDIRSQMYRLFGESGNEIVSIHLVDWRQERFSSAPDDAQGLRSHPSYGISASCYDDRLIFIGTETAFTEGGYLEGAIRCVEQMNSD